MPTAFDTLSRAFEAWNRGDLDTALAAVDPEIAWETANVFPDATGTFHGHDGVSEFWRRFREPWEEIRVDVERYVETGEIVVVEARFSAIGRDSGTTVSAVFGQLFEFRDGRLFHFQAFPDFAAAAAAAGADTGLARSP